jgi:nucleotidyltransferase/DNA polymerase involved in DNA repair
MKIRLEGYLTYTRSKSSNVAFQDKNKVLKIVLNLLNEFSENNKKVRLIGIRLSNLEKQDNKKQLDILQFS